MRYKVGDRVKIKTWKAMEKEFANSTSEGIKCQKTFLCCMEQELKELKCNRILTIKAIYDDFYITEEMDWNFSNDMIAYLAYSNIADNLAHSNTADNQQKTFRDLLGRDIKVGDNVLHLWTKIDRMGYPHGGVNKKLATVIKQTEKGISIEWRDPHDKRIIKKSNIKNTRNRLIVLDGKKLNLEIEDIVKNVQEAHEKDRKSKNTRIKNLSVNLKKTKKHRDKLTEENKELKKLIKELTKGSERFEILDIR